MRQLTVTIDTNTNAQLLQKMLQSVKFVKKVESRELYDDTEISEEEIQILEERWAEYKKNPKSGKSLEQVVQTLSKKHGFKNYR